MTREVYCLAPIGRLCAIDRVISPGVRARFGRGGFSLEFPCSCALRMASCFRFLDRRPRPVWGSGGCGGRAEVNGKLFPYIGLKNCVGFVIPGGVCVLL